MRMCRFFFFYVKTKVTLEAVTSLPAKFVVFFCIMKAFRVGSHYLLLIVSVLFLEACGGAQYVEKQCIYTVVSQGFGLPEFIEWRAQNDVTISYYDSDMVSKRPCPKWLRNSEEQEQWKIINEYAVHNRHIVTEAFHFALKQFNHTGSLSDGNIYQCYGCCHLYPDGKYTTFLTHSFNGKDFVSLDIEREIFIAAVPEAVHYVHLRNNNVADIKFVLNKCRKMCSDRLHTFKKDPRVIRREVPEVKIFQTLRDHNVIVTCHVTGFYPQAVQVDLLGKDLQPMDSVSTEVLPNEDGTFQTRKSVAIPTEDADKHSYTCVVLHSSVPGSITKVLGYEKHSHIALWIAFLIFLSFVSGLLFVCWRHSTDDGS